MRNEIYMPSYKRTTIVAGQKNSKIAVVEISELDNNDIEINGVSHNVKESTTTIFLTNPDEIDIFIKIFQKAKELLLSGEQTADMMFGGEIPRRNKDELLPILQ
jgi:glycine cleavage system protein P-like pyridoxal-binding family